jgi:uncharacterized protein with HEPN domain
MLTKDGLCLDSILESIEKIREYTFNFDNADQFYSDNLAFDAVLMNFVIIGEMVDKISTKLQNLHPEIEWGKIKGFRNLVAHDYFGIDAEEVWQIINQDLPVLYQQASKILKPD